MSSKKSQVSVLYFSFLVLFSVSFLMAVYMLSVRINEDSTSEFSHYLAQNVMYRIDKNILEIKDLKTKSGGLNITEITKVISIPPKIGVEDYLIRGNGSDIILQTYGPQSVIKRKKVYWWAVNLEGQALSSSSELKLVYDANDNKIRFS